MRYFALEVGDIPGISEDLRWYKQNRRYFTCPVCSNLLPAPAAPEIVIKRAPPPFPLNFAYTPDLKIMSDDLLQAMGGEVFRYVKVRRLKLQSGAVVEKFFLVVAQKTIIIRGGPKSTLQGLCPNCGMLYYWPRDAKDLYIMAKTVSDGLPIYEGNTSPFLLREDIVHRIPKDLLRDTHCYEIPVADAPRDHLPDDLQDNPSQEMLLRWGDALNRDGKAG